MVVRHPQPNLLCQCGRKGKRGKSKSIESMSILTIKLLVDVEDNVHSMQRVMDRQDCVLCAAD